MQFSVLLAFLVHNEALIQKEIIEESWVELNASSESEARQKAYHLGLKEEEIFENRYGEKVTWKFKDVKELIPKEEELELNKIQQPF